MRMPRRFVDLSVALENDVPADAPLLNKPKIAYVDHEQSLPDLLASFPGLTKEELPNGEAWAVEKIELTTHNGTHLDAPYHFASTMDKGALSQ
jgi:kynurenine formamidase